ncbi:hypothetical protein LTSEMIN_2701, partial [Salmonella enterica subsp. enterica serovar Minnesota str. A4-603]
MLPCRIINMLSGGRKTRAPETRDGRDSVTPGTGCGW